MERTTNVQANLAPVPRRRHAGEVLESPTRATAGFAVHDCGIRSCWTRRPETDGSERAGPLVTDRVVAEIEPRQLGERGQRQRALCADLTAAELEARQPRDRGQRTCPAVADGPIECAQ